MNYSFLVALSAVAVLFGVPLLVGASVEAKRRRTAELASAAREPLKHGPFIVESSPTPRNTVRVETSALIQLAIVTIQHRELPKNQVTIDEPRFVLPLALTEALRFQRDRPKA